MEELPPFCGLLLEPKFRQTCAQSHTHMHTDIHTHVNNMKHKPHAREEEVERKVVCLVLKPVMLHGASGHFQKGPGP